MPDSSPQLAAVISAAIETKMVDVHTSLPARVESYDAGAQTADVKPMIRRVMRSQTMERVAEDLPVIPTVPVLWPRGGGAFLSLPLAAGDFGLLVLTEYSIDRFRSTGEDTDPGDERRHDLANAVFIPCALYPRSQSLSDVSDTEVRFGLDSDYVAAVRSGEVAFPKDATTFLARADRTLSELQAIVDVFNTHVHTGGTLTGGLTGKPNVTLPNPGNPASDTVKGT